LSKKGAVFLFLFFFSCSPSFQEQSESIDDTGRNSSLVITSPQNDYTAENQTVTVKGYAYDEGGIDSVEIKVNSGVYEKADGKTVWEKTVSLTPGENRIMVRMINTKMGVIKTDPIYIYALWTRKAELPIPFSHSNAVYLGGQFLIFGGKIYDASLIGASKDFIKYDASLNTASKIGVIPKNSYSANTVVYQNLIYSLGAIYYNYQVSSPTLLIYQPDSTVTYSLSTPSPYDRGGAATALIGNKAYLIGGLEWNRNPLSPVLTPVSTILEHDLDTHTWAVKSPLNLDKIPSFAYASAVSYQNQIFIFGGVDSNGVYQKNIYLYRPIDNTIEVLENRLAYKRAGFQAVLIGNKAYLIGGKGYSLEDETKSVVLDAVEVFQLDEMRGFEIHKMPKKLAYSAVSTDGEKIYLFGGQNENSIPLNSIYEYTPLLDPMNQ